MKYLRQIFIVICLLSGMVVKADNSSALDKVCNLFVNAIMSNNKEQIYILKDSIGNLVERKEFKPYKVTVKRLIYIHMANYKFNSQELDLMYNFYIWRLLKDPVFYLDDLNNDYKIAWFSGMNLVWAKVLMDFVEDTVHKPVIYIALSQIAACLNNIDSTKWNFTDSDLAELKLFGIKNPSKEIELIRHRRTLALESLQKEFWYDKVKILSKYPSFKYDFKKSILDFLELGLDDSLKYKMDVKCRARLNVKESDFLWALGFYLNKRLSDDYSSISEFNNVILYMYRKGTDTGMPQPWLLYINKCLEVYPVESRANTKLWKTLTGLKSILNEEEFAFWKGFDSLADFLDGDDDAVINEKLDYYCKILMNRNYDIDNIVQKSQDILYGYANNKSKKLFKDQYVAIPQKIAMCRRLRDINENYFVSKKKKDKKKEAKETTRNVNLSTLGYLADCICKDDKADWSRYLSPKEKDELIEYSSIMSVMNVVSSISSIDNTLSCEEIEAKTERLNNYSKVLRYFEEDSLITCIDRLRFYSGSKDSIPMVQMMESTAEIIVKLISRVDNIQNLCSERYFTGGTSFADIFYDLGVKVVDNPYFTNEDKRIRLLTYYKAIQYLGYNYISAELARYYKLKITGDTQSDNR